MKRLLHLVTDFSFVGGDHVYVMRLLRHLAKQHAGEFELHVAEIRAHATGEELGVYAELEQLGVTLHSIGSGQSGYLGFNIPRFVAQVVRDHRIDVVHTHIFIADLAVAAARLGSVTFIENLTGDGDFRNAEVIDEIIRSGITDLSEIYLDMLPVRGVAQPSELEPTEFRWVSTKHLGALKSICQERDLEKLYPEDNEQRDAGHRLNRYLQRFTSQLADEVVTISSNAKALWSEFLSDPLYIPVAVIGEPEWDRIAAAGAERGLSPSPRNGRTFAFVGRLARKKNPLLLIEAFLEHAADYRDDRLKIVGDGRLMRRCRELANGCDRVEFEGHVSANKVLEILSQSDAVCLFSDEEGLPLVVQEAMASGVPVLASRAGGIPDLVESGRSGLLVDRVDKEAVAATLRSYANLSLGERRAMSEAARQRMRSWVTDTECFEEYASLYAG